VNGTSAGKEAWQEDMSFVTTVLQICLVCKVICGLNFFGLFLLRGFFDCWLINFIILHSIQNLYSNLLEENISIYLSIDGKFLVNVFGIKKDIVLRFTVGELLTFTKGACAQTTCPSLLRLTVLSFCYREYIFV